MSTGAATPCAVCAENAIASSLAHGILFEDNLWLLHSSGPPYGVAGWLTLQTKRHVPGPFEFSDAEAASFGPTLRAACAALLSASGAAKVYTAALGEAHAHFHCHLVPRAVDAAVKGWALFGQQAEAAAGRVEVDPARVEEICLGMRERMAAWVAAGCK